MTNEEKINLIGQKILLLSNNLDKYHYELAQLKQQLEALQQGTSKQQNIVPPVVKVPEEKIEIVPEVKVEVPDVKVENPELKTENTSTPLSVTINEENKIIPPIQQQNIPPTPPKQKSDFNFEAFVGGKLITIIGIIILVIGLGIGVKYAIDNEMLGPLARIVLAYVAGGILLFIALRLKANYKTFSAVLLSGGMASLYFTTFIAYSLYGMFGQIAAFAIMVVFTMFTVFAATVYNLQVIGIIGLVGAYAVPMLLSDGSGRIEIMFSYMVIVNIGILVLSFKKDWQLLNHLAFGFTWLIFLSWFLGKFNHEIHTTLSLSFAFLFFIIFYISSMSYKIVKQEKFGVLDVISIVFNSFIFFGLGYATLNHESTEDYLGIFTVANALIHFVFAFIVFKNKLLDRKLFYLLIALVLSFITIAVPVQLERNWVTLFWATEAVLLFSIGRYKAVRFYEWLGYFMILFSVFSLLQDWGEIYKLNQYYYGVNVYQNWKPIFNIYLFTSLFVTSAIGAMIYVHYKKPISEEVGKTVQVYVFIEYAMAVAFFLLAYFSFSNEITTYYQSAFENSLIKVPSKEVWAEPGAIMEIRDHSILQLQNIALIIYNILFFIVFSILSIYKMKTPAARWTAFGINILISIGFVTAGLTDINSLDNELHKESEYFALNTSLTNLRYVCYALFATLLYYTYQVLKTDTFKKFTISKIYIGCIVHLFILVVLSYELVYIQEIRHAEYDYYRNNTVYKLGFTALWGIYSFIMIAFGMWKKKQIMRIAAISLFGITLVKLLTFDTWDLSTGYKVIAYILLGVILLVVSFLYQKFKSFIFGDDNK